MPHSHGAGWRGIASVLVALFLTLPGMARAGDGQLLKAVLLVVNGRHITQDDLYEAAEFLIRYRNPGVELEKLRLTEQEQEQLTVRSQHLLIRIWLIQEEARTLNIAVTDETVRTRMQRLGIDRPEMPALARKYAESECLVDEIFSSRGILPYTPTPREVRDFYQKERDTVFTSNRMVRVRHLFLSTAIDGPDAVERRIRQLREQILAKAPQERSQYFSRMARDYSQDQFASIGGLLKLGGDPEGWFPQAVPNKRSDGSKLLPDGVFTAIRDMDQQDLLQLTEPIASEEGFHLLLLEGLKGGNTMPWSQAQILIRQMLERRKRDQRVMEWLRRRVPTSRITWHDGSPYPSDSLFTEDVAPDTAAP